MPSCPQYWCATPTECFPLEWFKFNWNGRTIRESTKQGNKRIAEQIESARKTALAKGEVGIRDRAPVPILKDFAERDFLPHIQSLFAEKASTLAYYRVNINHLTGHAPLAKAKLDSIPPEALTSLIERRREADYEVSSINRTLQVLRRMLHVAIDWGKIDKVPLKISLLPGENKREGVLSNDEEVAYLKASPIIGEKAIASYKKALGGIRATLRGQKPIEPKDPFVLRDVAMVLVDCGLRPEECYRLRFDEVRDDNLNIAFGKTRKARRIIPMTNRVKVMIDMRRTLADSEWVFAAETKSGHINQSSLKKQHAKACKLAEVEFFVPYTLRHTCLTRWAKYMDPYTLAYLAGHSDFGTTKRYVHPQMETVRAAMEKARGGHISGHSANSATDGGVAESALIN